MAQKKNSENIGDMLTPAGLAKIKVGQTLGFKQEDGTIKNYKVVKRRVKRQELWVRPIQLYKPEQVKVVDNEQN
ncbi:hypothetical protein ACFU44_13805 [Nocardia rhizosphaerihabitans]|uniref:hypothetical protein n=1 Tax=Nocardia rhizosphaerihabitans TaxID=1691570 RepID=UPI003671FBAB